MTVGFGPGGASGISSRTGTKPFWSSTMRTSLGVVAPLGGRGGAAVRTQAARHATQIAAKGRRRGTEAPKLGKSRPAATPKGRAAAVLAALVLAAGCAPRPLLERAIRARGGPLVNIARQVEADVYRAFPGTWRWHTVYMVPDRYAWTIFTAAEPDHYLFDGTTVRAFIGGRQVSADSDPSAPLRSHARFTAVVNLDALRLPGVRMAPLPEGELPPGASAGLAVVLADDGAQYRLGFDRRGLLVWAEGPVRLPPLGEGRVVARFSDFRRVAGFLVPFRTSYTVGDQPLADERALAVCPADPAVSLESFRTPRLLPDCGTPLPRRLSGTPASLRPRRLAVAAPSGEQAAVAVRPGVGGAAAEGLPELVHDPVGELLRGGDQLEAVPVPVDGDNAPLGLREAGSRTDVLDAPADGGLVGRHVGAAQQHAAEALAAVGLPAGGAGGPRGAREERVRDPVIAPPRPPREDGAAALAHRGLGVRVVLGGARWLLLAPHAAAAQAAHQRFSP